MNTPGIWSEPLRCSGKPCIRGTRFSLSQILAEMAEGVDTIKGLAEDFELEYDKVKLAWTDLIQELGKLKLDTEYILSDPDVRGGENCLRWHRIPISQVLMDLLEENSTAKEEASDYALEPKKVEGMLWNLASLLDHNWIDGPPEIAKEGKGPICNK